MIPATPAAAVFAAAVLVLCVAAVATAVGLAVAYVLTRA